MSNTLTRSQIQEEILMEAAQKGNFYACLKLFPNERKRLNRRGFTVICKNSGNNEIPCTVHFLNAFNGGIPQRVLNYLLGNIHMEPEYENYSQRLFVTAFKTAYIK